MGVKVRLCVKATSKDIYGQCTKEEHFKSILYVLKK